MKKFISTTCSASQDLHICTSSHSLITKLSNYQIIKFISAWAFEKVLGNSVTLTKIHLLMDNSFLGTTQTPAGPVTDSDRILAILSHVLTLVAWIFAPLVIYLVKKDESPFVREHAKESLNFQLTLILA